MAVNWGIGAPVNVGAMFTQGFEHGQQQAKERATDNALAAYAQNPNDPNAVNALMRVNPRIGFQLHQDQQKNQKQERVKQLTMKVAQGDHSALPELLFEAPEIWTRLDKKIQDEQVAATQYMANAGLQIGQMPEGQRSAAWDGYVKQAEAAGMDVPAQYERYTPQAFNAAMAFADKMKEFLASQKIDWKSVPLGATLVPMNAGTGERLDVPQTQGGGDQAVDLTPEQAAPIIQSAQQSGTIRQVDAQAIIKTLGPNGRQAFQQWMQKHNVRVQDGGQIPPPPPGFVLDGQ